MRSCVRKCRTLRLWLMRCHGVFSYRRMLRRNDQCPARQAHWQPLSAPPVKHSSGPKLSLRGQNPDRLMGEIGEKEAGCVRPFGPKSPRPAPPTAHPVNDFHPPHPPCGHLLGKPVWANHPRCQPPESIQRNRTALMLRARQPSSTRLMLSTRTRPGYGVKPYLRLCEPGHYRAVRRLLGTARIPQERGRGGGDP